MIAEKELYEAAKSLLKKLIATPSFSTEEDNTAILLMDFLKSYGIEAKRVGNNVWAKNKYFDPSLPGILLNSHHDTVRPNPAYTRDPFEPTEEDGKLYGLGSNDAGGCLVSLLATFVHFYEQKGLKYNIIIAASAEEENSGKNGIEKVLPALPPFELAIVGEPTLTQLAIAEKGLMVLDCKSRGKAGHAARDEGDNAIYNAMPDIEWFRIYQFPKVSKALGPIKMSVTMINAGRQHNVVPAVCDYVVDVRVTDEYTHEEILDIIRQNVKSEVEPRSLRMRSSGIDRNHAIVESGVKLGKELFGSPTTSDQALIPSASVKVGPGDSARSHMADEFIYLDEIKEGIKTYIGLVEGVAR